MGSPPLLFAGFLPHRISLADRNDLTEFGVSRGGDSLFGGEISQI